MFTMSAKIIDNNTYQGMSLKSLLETTNLFQIPGLMVDENGEKIKNDPSKKKESDKYDPTSAFLGPDLWDNTQKMSLEYMDLDEFLNENNISPLELCMSPTGAGQSSPNRELQQQDQRLQTPPMSPNKLADYFLNDDHESPSMGSMTVIQEDDSPPQINIQPESPMQFINPIVIGGPREISPERDDLSQDSITVPPKTPENSSFVIRVSAKPGLSTFIPPNMTPARKVVDVDFELNETDLALATVPGLDFDPRKRAFTDEELKPQPMIKKSRKQYVPSEMKDEHYWSRRNKNNVAAKRSREARRLKENQIAMRANFLEKENRALSIELAKCKGELGALKKRLTMYETQNST